MQMTTTPPVNYRLELGLRITMDYQLSQLKVKDLLDHHRNGKSCSQGTASFVLLGFGELALDALDALGILGASSESGTNFDIMVFWTIPYNS